MRRIIACIAISTDGFIARPDGDVSWLDRPRIASNYGMHQFYRSIDTVLMGRKTYDFAVRMGQSSYPGKQNFVFSRTARQSTTPEVKYIVEEPGEFAKGLRVTPGTDIWVVGGGELIGSLLDAGQVDEFMIHVIPILIGEGIPLLHPRHRNIPLVLLSARSFPDGVVRLHYRVERRAGGSVPGAKRPRRRSN
jgi:dihydrofolate reductase